MEETFVQKRLFFGLGIVALVLFAGSDVFGQSATSKYEVGVQFSLIRFSDLDITEPGFGVRFTYNINKHVAVEAEGNVFPRDSFPVGHKSEALFGVKAGARSRRVGLFGKIRPGFMNFTNFERAFGPCFSNCPSQPPRLNFSETDFALDVGAVAEFYTSRRTFIR